MNLSKEIFWDVDFQTIDYVKNQDWVICRVLDRGTLKDWFQIKEHYGINKILSVAQDAKYLSKKTIYFLSAIYNIPLTHFRCYNLMQFQQEQWIY
jgi:hypothetical protein